MKMNNKFNLSNKQLLDILKRIFCDNGFDIGFIKDGVKLDEVNDFAEFYINIIYLLFKDLYENKMLARGFNDYRYKELSCYASEVNWERTIQTNSLMRGRIVQNVAIPSVDCEINNLIGDCLRMFFSNENIKLYGKDFEQKVSSLYKKVFNRDFSYLPYDNDLLARMDDSIYKYYGGDLNVSFPQYRMILYVCKLLIEDIYYKDDRGENDGIVVDLSFEYIMQRLLMSSVRRVSKQLSVEYPVLKGVCRVWESDLLLIRDDGIRHSLRGDVLFKSKNFDLAPNILFEVKTNEKLSDSPAGSYKLHNNVLQCLDYWHCLCEKEKSYSYAKAKFTEALDRKEKVVYNDFEIKYGNNNVVLFHFLPESSKEDMRFDKMKSKRGSLIIRTFVYTSETTTKDLDVFIKEIIKSYLKKGVVK